MKKKIIAVIGPTASGKTALSIALAKKINGEIISCDSMQIYKKMDIGTAKPTKEEQAMAIHHLIDVVEPNVEFSCADYSVLAKQKIEEISRRGKVPIFCGGTGLYIDHVLFNTSFSDAGQDTEYRKYLEDMVEKEGVLFVHSLLAECDKESAQKIHPNNVKRVIRALEIYHLTGKTKSEWDRESRNVENPYDSRSICLDFKNRDILYDRINKRVDIMVEYGLLDEVKNLYENGELSSKTASQAIGYKEIVDYYDGRCTLDDAIENIKQSTRNYAKRQLTWFKRYENCYRIYVDECRNFDEIVNNAENALID